MALLWYAWARQQLAEVALLPTFSLRLDLPLDGQVVGDRGLGVGSLRARAGRSVPRSGRRVVNAREALGANSRAAGGVSVSRLRRVLVAAQVGVTLALVAGAVLLTRSLDQLTRAGISASPRPDWWRSTSIWPRRSPPRRWAALAAEALRRVTTLPGVAGAAMASRAPIDASMPRVEVRPASRPSPSVGDVTTAGVTADTTSPRWACRCVAGRGFTADESRLGADVAIVNERLAMTICTRRATSSGRSVVVGADRRRTTVIGVARDAKYARSAERGGLHLYQPVAPNFALTLLVRATGDPRRTLSSVQQVLDGVGPGVVGFFPRTMDDHLSSRPAAGAGGGRGGDGFRRGRLALSAVGLYGLVAWLVERRRREIAVQAGARSDRDGRAASGRGRSGASRCARNRPRAGCWRRALGYAVRSMLVGVGPFDVRGLAGSVPRWSWWSSASPPGGRAARRAGSTR